MIRLFNIYFPTRTVILAVGELVLIAGSFIAAVAVLAGPSTFSVLSSAQGLYKILAICGFCFLCFYYFDLYVPGSLNPGTGALLRMFSAVGLISILLGLISYLIPQLVVLPGVYLLGIVFLAIVLTGWRSLSSRIATMPYFHEKVVILGNGKLAAELIQEIGAREELGIKVVACIGADGQPAQSVVSGEVITVLNKLSKESGFGRIIVATSERRGTLPINRLLEFRLKGVRVEYATKVLEKITGKIETESLNPSWLVFGEGIALNGFHILTKHIVSVVFASLGLVLSLPLALILVALIKLDSPGPVFYRQRRVGWRGKVFYLYKFRTMRADAEAETGPVWAAERDARITRVGRWLRKLRLDEIPQFYNVLRGDMSLVGPRPERPEFVRELVSTIHFYKYRHAIRPGITGWAQIQFRYGSTADEAHIKLKYDLFYIKNMSPLLDLFIIFQTVKFVLLARGSR